MSRVLSYFKSLVTMTILTNADFQENCLTSSGTRSFGRKLPVRPWKVLQDIGLQSCLRECEKQTACKSINYNLIFYGCEFLDTKTNDSTRFEQNANYVYGEIYNENNNNNRTCGDKVCNNNSTCISTSSNNTFCIATECTEPIHLPENGIVINQTYSPPSVTFGCNEGYIAIGHINTTTCVPGRNWSSLSFLCERPGPLRLENGTSPSEGRVEIYINSTWGTIFDDNWTETEASVVCTMLGYIGLATPRSLAYFGKGSGPIWLDNVNCSGSEDHLLECKHLNIGSHNCYHYEDAGVTCE